MAAILRVDPSPLHREPNFELKKRRGFLEKVVRKVSKWHHAVNAVVFAINDSLRPLTSLMRIPKPGVGMTVGFSAFSCVDIVFAGPRFIFAIKDLFTAKTTYGKVYSLFRSAAEFATVAAETLWIIEGLKKLEIIAKTTLPWTSIVSTVLLPFQFICLPFAAYQIYKVNSLRRALQQNFKNPHRFETEEKRIENVTRALKYVKREHVSIREKLSISKQAKLRSRAETFLRAIHKLAGEKNEKKLENAENFMSILRTRVRARTVLEIGAATAQVAILALLIADLCSPGAPAVPILLIVAAVSSLAFTIFDWTLFDKNPFDEKPDTLFHKSVKIYRDTVFTASSYAYKAAKFVTIKPVKYVCRKVVELAKFAIEERAKDPFDTMVLPYMTD